MTAPIGWYVRIKTGEVVDGVYDTVLYIAGYLKPAEAEAAVRRVRAKSGEHYEVLEGGIVAGHGPQPTPGEVRIIKGAV
jgi:hypothetical protein